MKKIQPIIMFLFLSGLFGTVTNGLASTAPDPTDISRWENFLDPSLILDLTLQGDEIYAATYGGILVYDINQSSFRQYTTRDGLPSNNLSAVTFDPGGDLYIGTADAGIARVWFQAGRLDVSSMTAIFHGLAGDNVNALTAWGDTIVYGTNTGAGLIINAVPNVTFYMRNGLPSDRVNDVLADGDRVWMVTDSGVVILDQLGFLHDVTNNLPSINAQVVERCDTAVWIGSAKGVARFNPADSSWTPLGLLHQPIYSLYLDGTTLWAGGDEYLYNYDGAAWDSVSLFPIYSKHTLNANNSQISSMLRGPDNNLYLGIADPNVERRGGDLIVYDGSTLQDLRPNMPQQNHIIRFSFDIDGSLWFATWSFGIGKLTPTGNWMNYNSTTPGGSNLSSLFLNAALVTDLDGVKWIGGLSQLSLNELDDGQDEDFGNDVWDHHGIGSGGGDGIGWLGFLRARMDPAGNLWFLGDQAAPTVTGNIEIQILSRDKTEWRQVTPLTTNGGLWGGKMFDVAFGPNGVVYVASNWTGVQEWRTGGYDWANLSDLSGDVWSPIARVEVELSSDADVEALALGDDGILWIGTTDGLYKYNGNLAPEFRIKRIPVRQGFNIGLLGVMVKDLLFDREGNLWVGTDKGLNRIAADNDNDIAAYTTAAAYQAGLHNFYDLSVISPLVNAFVEGLVLHPTEDVLYIGTAGGLSVFDITPAPPQPTDLSAVYVYPNPVYGRKGHFKLKIGEISGPVFVEIYSLEGELVHSQWVSGPAEPEAWDLTTEGGFLVSSGIYLVRIKSEGRTVIKRVSVIR